MNNPLLQTIEALAKEKGIEQGGWVRVSCECGAQLVRRADED